MKICLVLFCGYTEVVKTLGTTAIRDSKRQDDKSLWKRKERRSLARAHQVFTPLLRSTYPLVGSLSADP